MRKHVHKWVPLRRGFPQEICRCGAMSVLDLKIGKRTIYVTPGGVEVLRWTKSQDPVQLGDVGMDIATGHLRAYVGGSAKDCLVTGEGGGGGAVTFNEPAGDNSAGTQAIFDSDTVGEAVAFPDLLYEKSDGKWWKADANAASTMPGMRLALETKLANATCSMLRMGRVRDDDWNWTVGGLIYASAAVVGGMTQTPPSGSGDQIQVVGQAYHADKMMFDPFAVMAEVV